MSCVNDDQLHRKFELVSFEATPPPRCGSQTAVRFFKLAALPCGSIRDQFIYLFYSAIEAERTGLGSWV